MTIGEKLRNLRVRTKKTLKEQSAIFGVSLNSIYRWEHGLASPRRPVLEKMADFYDVPLSWLLGGSSDDYDEYVYGIPHLENGLEQQLLQMFRKLPENKKYKILGYIERVYVEDMDKMM